MKKLSFFVALLAFMIMLPFTLEAQDPLYVEDFEGEAVRELPLRKYF